jgi:hypothetical protein
MRKFAIAIFVLIGCFAGSAGFASARQTSASKKSAATKTRRASVRRTSTRRRHHYSRHRYHGPAKPTTERISEIQSALARGGYYHGDQNGKWDSNTVDAMRKFQEDNGLDGTGKIDALSLQKLGLGSQIAGVDPPRAPAPGQSTLTPTQSPAPASSNKPKPQTPKSPDPDSSVSRAPSTTGAAPSATPTPKVASAPQPQSHRF